MSDNTKEFGIAVGPHELTEEQWDTIRKIARVVREKYQCDYTQAVIYAYIEWLEMAVMDQTQH